ncbi:amidohydrolase family protein [Sulfuracidifex metallicus]|uniref:Amidohydrolase family protein n=2 Tax=Sulfuracidifex metallicus TaxID=47303 RepID=A0A6A9QLT1_SULME|nr:amidohydrolase family protein [Sulfuracidifex metallicus]MUN29109.1 amidohydrolase family protein [Sulfuracidifex metallicus DSM 6482 = JCM 9184]WOE50372.1 amidohydrolase family protein [Sulfuracidifex metallicus DSM 6482 = JCM 9184]
MLIKNARVIGKDGLFELCVEEGLLASGCKKDGSIFDAEGRLVVPGFVNPHSHLGYSVTLRYGKPNQSGTLHEGIIRNLEDVIPKLTCDDVRRRLKKITTLMFVNGVTHVRTHEPFMNGLMYKVHKAREEIPLDLQVVAFPTPGVYRYEIEEEFRKASLMADVIGMIPHGERTFMEGVESVKLAFSLAKENNKMIDGHVDETDDPNSRFTEEVVKEAIRNGMGEKVTISHMTASHSYDSWYFDKLMSMMVSSKVNVVSNPIVSMHLQGRYDSYPKRRGVARIRQMMKAGINVALGTDNIADMIYPLGEGNMLRVAQEAFLVDHFVSEEIYSLMNMITWNGAKAMSLNNYGIGEGRKADFVVLNARSIYEAIRSALPPALVVYGKHYVVNDLKFSIDGNDVTGLVENLTD